jgi:hypothetical protein
LFENQPQRRHITPSAEDVESSARLYLAINSIT